MDFVFISKLLACAFYRWVESFTLGDINDQWLLSPVNLVFIVDVVNLCVFSSFPWDLQLLDHQLSLLVWPTSGGWSFPPSILCTARFVDSYWWNLVLSWNILFSLSIIIESFSEYCSLGWHLWSLNVCIMIDYNLLAFIVSNEKSGVILISLPSYVIWTFYFASLNILSLICIFCVLIIMWREGFF